MSVKEKKGVVYMQALPAKSKKLMRKYVISILFVVVSLGGFSQKTEGLALTPPMGWNSWNTFACDIDEDLIKGIADAMVETGLRDAGYVYLVLDDGWMAMQRNKDGKLYGDPKKFPGGMETLGEYIHSKGLKFGIYNCAGSKTCGGYPGSRGYEFIDEETLKTLTNKEVIAVNQDSIGIQGFRYLNEHNIETWIKPLSNGDWAISFVNMNQQPSNLDFDWQKHELGDDLNQKFAKLNENTFKIRDLFNHKDLEDTSKSLKAAIGAHDVLMLRLVRQ